MGFSSCSWVLFFNSISNNRALVILQSVSEEWTELPWLTTSYSSQWTNVVVFLFTFINIIFFAFAFLYLVVSNQSCMIAVVQMQFK